jgi:sulfur carrier protein ThiS
MAVPTRGETYAKLLEHLRLAQEDAAMMGHLLSAEGSKEDRVLGNAWLTVSELIRKMGLEVTQLATRGLQ